MSSPAHLLVFCVDSRLKADLSALEKQQQEHVGNSQGEEVRQLTAQLRHLESQARALMATQRAASKVGLQPQQSHLQSQRTLVWSTSLKQW